MFEKCSQTITAQCPFLMWISFFRMRLSIPFSLVSWRAGYMVSILSLETTSSFLRDFLGTNSKILHHIPEYQGILDLHIERVFHGSMSNKKILFLFRSNMTQCS
jgi:hypothetical protein